MSTTGTEQLRYVRATNLLDEVRDAIRRAKGDDPFAPVWIWAPHARAVQSLQVRLARNGGLLNVSLMTERDLIQHLLGVEASKLSHMHSALMRVLASQVMAQAKPPLSGHKGSKILDAFVFALKELRSRSIGELQVIADSDDPMASELVRLYELYREMVKGRYFDSHDLRELALSIEVDHPPVIAVVTEPPEWYSADLLQKVMKQPGSATVAVESSVQHLDDALRVWLWGVEREQSLFKDVSLPSTAGDERIVVAPDVSVEVDLAIAQLLEAANDGVAFSEMAVLFPEPSPHWALLVSRLQEARIPFRGRVPGKLSQSPLGRFVLHTVDVFAQDFSLDALEVWLSEPCLVDPLTSAQPAVGDWIDAARRARIAGGAQNVVDRLNLFADSLDEAREFRIRNAALRFSALVDDFHGLLGAGRQLPTTWKEWAAFFQQCIERYIGGADSRRDWSKYQQQLAIEVERRIKKLESLDAVTSGSVDVELVLDTLSSAFDGSLPSASDHRGVLIGSFSDAVCARFERLVLCGLNEGLMPPTESRGALQVSLRVPGQEVIAEKQLRAFHHALAGCDNRILMCARVDQRAQRERLPSPWLLERASHLAGTRVGAHDLYSEHRDWPWLEVIPSFSSYLSSTSRLPVPAHDQLASLKTWAECDLEVDLHPIVSTSDHAKRAIQMVRSRDGDFVSRFDGLVGVIEGFNPFDKPISPTRFEDWATCPARYFYSSVLRLVNREDDDHQLGLSGRARGTAVHDVLDRFMKTVAPRSHPTQPWTAEEKALLHRIGDEVLAEALSAGVTQHGLLHNIERRRLHDELDRFLESDEKFRGDYGVIPQQTGTEVAFGIDDVPPVEVPRPTGMPVKFRGRVDRIDKSPDGSAVAVVDYKTGKKTYLGVDKNDPVSAGKKIQLAVYGAAMSDESTAKVTSAYWLTSDSSVKDPLVPVAYDATTKARFEEVVGLVASGIERGLFVAIPGKEVLDSFENCRMCAYDDICVADRDEAWERKMHDSVTLPWRSLDPSFEVEESNEEGENQ